MPAQQADGRIDSPLFVVINNATINAGATENSLSVPCAGHEAALIVYTCSQTHNRAVQVSDDDATWYDLNSGGLNGAAPGATGVTGGTNRAVAVPLAGARFLRLSLGNTAGGAATATAKVMLG